MSELKIGDIVARKSYGCDVFFKVTDIKDTGGEKVITIKGISYRIEADAPEADLELQTDNKVREYREKCCRLVEKHSTALTDKARYTANFYMPRYRVYRKKTFSRDTANEEPDIIKRPGTVLHIDGDKEYLDNCLDEYRKLAINVVGRYVPEKDQPGSVAALLKEHSPDILVLTGHDGFLKGEDSYKNVASYRNSKHFIDAVKEARRFNSDMDGLVIFAGACQSLFQEIMNAGANFASAPFRDLIHALDPVRVCQKVAFTGIDNVLDAEDVIGNTITGKTGIGGIQTRGKYRTGYPREPYQ